MMVSTSAIRSAATRGTTRRFTDPIRTRRASIWSLERIAPSSAVIPADMREATTMPTRMGPRARTTEITMKWPSCVFAPVFASSRTSWIASACPATVAETMTISSEPTSAKWSWAMNSCR